MVRGVVGRPRSYLADTQREILTDYPVTNPVFLYSRDVWRTAKPDPSAPDLAVTLLGGTITIDGLTFTSEHEALPGLQSGAEYLLLLKRVSGKYFIVGQYYGAFRISASTLVAETRKSGFASEYAKMPATDAIDDIVAQLRNTAR